MLKKLQQRWKVNAWNLVLILITFSIGGSLCGWLGRKILLLTNFGGITWGVLYIILVTLLWPVCVLLISIPLGQFSFFKNYLTRVWKKMSGKKRDDQQGSGETNIAIFASGAGSNAKKIIEHFKNPKNNGTAKVSLIVSNKPGAGVLKIAEENNVPVLIIEKERFFNVDGYVPELRKRGIDFIVLAGFLWKFPPVLLNEYPKKIINIHPALLPKYGGKGMYGNHVHEAVIANKENESGISIHFADEHYDHGEIIKQVSCKLNEADTIETLSKKIHQLEHEHYPRIIEEVLKKQNPR